ncbi:MAG: N-acetyl sugar amidotransferase [Candidatus Omnitrophota bacterium]
MRYCKRCVYPESSAVKLTFDERGICSGCRVAEEKEKLDWGEREKQLRKILESYKGQAEYDCIIPVSGGKDSHYQVYLIKEVYGLNPLLVTFNHTFNTRLGIDNLTNLVEKFGCDHLRFTPSPKTVKKLARVALKKMGDFCWHCHCGIFTYPVQVAVKYRIPLLIWGEQGFLDLGGMFSHYDMIEMTRRFRTEHGLRGYDYSDLIDEKEGITAEDLRWAVYPSDKDIERVGVRGIYLGNFVNWNGKKQTEFLIKNYNFQTARESRSYNTYENVECHHCGGAHDYLKWLKFGYGRATDHASQDIRLGRMTREEGVDMVEKYDAKRPNDLDPLLDWLEISEEEFVEAVDGMRDPRAWKKENGKWILQDHVRNHRNDPGVEEVRVPLDEEKRKTREYVLTCPRGKFADGYVRM